MRLYIAFEDSIHFKKDFQYFVHITNQLYIRKRDWQIVVFVDEFVVVAVDVVVVNNINNN